MWLTSLCALFSLVNRAVNIALPAHLQLSAALRPGLGAVAAAWALAAVGRYLLSARHSAANPPHAATAVE